MQITITETYARPWILTNEKSDTQSHIKHKLKNMLEGLR